jgi:hypothetical protein
MRFPFSMRSRRERSSAKAARFEYYGVTPDMICLANPFVADFLAASARKTRNGPDLHRRLPVERTTRTQLMAAGLATFADVRPTELRARGKADKKPVAGYNKIIAKAGLVAYIACRG